MTLAKYLLPVFLVGGIACNYSERKIEQDIGVEKTRIQTENYLPPDYKTKKRLEKENIREIPNYDEPEINRNPIYEKPKKEIPPHKWGQKLKAKYA